MNHKLLSRKQFEYYLLKLQLHLESVPLTSRAVNAMSSLAHPIRDARNEGEMY